MVWYRWYSNTTLHQTTVTENTTTSSSSSSYIRSRSSNMNQPVYSTTTSTTNHSNVNINNNNHNKKYRYINYHLLSQSKVRQQHLLRCYVRTNNLKRIQDYYQSIQNYYYHTQQVLERTQQQRIQCPSNRRQQRKRNRNRKNDTPDEDDDEDSIYIRIDCGVGSMENDNDDDDDSCLPDEENHDPDMVFISPLNNNRNNTGSTGTDQNDVAEVTADTIADHLLSPSLSVPQNSTNNHVNRMTTMMLPLNHLHSNEYNFFARASNADSSPNNNNTGTAVMMMSPVYTMLDIDASINPNETLNWTILYYACFHHQYDIVKYLIEECYASLKCTDRYHNTILHWICHYPLPTPSPTVTLSDQGRNRHCNKTKTTTRTIQRFINYYHHHYHRSQPPGQVNNDPNMKNIVLLLQYIMECSPTLILVCNNYKELPIHWLCQYGNNNPCLIQCMIQFIQTNPYFTTNQNTVTTTNTSNNHRSETETTTTTITTRGSSSSSLRRLLYQEDQYHRTPMDVARLYHNDDIAQYLQSLLV